MNIFVCLFLNCSIFWVLEHCFMFSLQYIECLDKSSSMHVLVLQITFQIYLGRLFIYSFLVLQRKRNKELHRKSTLKMVTNYFWKRTKTYSRWWLIISEKEQKKEMTSNPNYEACFPVQLSNRVWFRISLSPSYSIQEPLVQINFFCVEFIFLNRIHPYFFGEGSFIVL